LNGVIFRGEIGERMRKAVAIGVVLALATLVFIATPLKVWSPSIDMIKPEHGKAGHVTIIHGDGFTGANVEVKFGTAKADKADVISDKVIRTTVPPKHPLDIFFNVDPVPVMVTVDGVSIGEMPFSYKIQKPEPVITGFDPKFVVVGTEFTIMVYGTSFTTAQGRVPDQVFLIGPEVVEATILECDACTCLMGVEPSPFYPTGYYEILISFSDGSGAVAEGYFEVIPS
jgi:hypothetical protein